MKLSISITSAHAVNDPRDGVRAMRERASAAADAGLDKLFVGDHHATPIPYFQNVPILGHLLSTWPNRPCGALFLLPLWHPVLLAEQVGTLASIAQGPFILQCAVGNADRQFDAMGVPGTQRPSRFEQSLDIVRRLWRGEEVDSDGRWTFSRARIAPRPPQPVEVWIGAAAPVAIDRAARLGDAWIAGPNLVEAEAREQLEHYRSRRAEHGKGSGRATIRRDIYVAADDRDVARMRDASRGYRGFPAAALTIGTSDRVVDRFAELAAMGYDEIIVRNLAADPADALAATERLAAVVEAVSRLEA